MTKVLIADAHTHVFNAGFLPIEGILMSRGVPQEVAREIADFIENRVERDWPPPAPSRASESERRRQLLYEMLEEELISPSEVETSRAPDLIDRVVDLALDDDSADRHGDRARLKQLLHAADQQAGSIETGEDSNALSTWGVGSFIEWILILLIHESRIEKAYSRVWEGQPTLDRRVHHMMDMEKHYPSDRVLYPLQERHERMRRIGEEAKLPLVGFAAFDPFRDHCQDIIEDAISAGFAGIKFYPPSGYRPIGNSADDIKHGPPHELVNRRNMELFEFCVKAKVPVFTHCTNGGMESRKKTGRFSDPAGWRQVLETDGLSSLRLCLGHAGGQEGWFAETDEDFEGSWAGEVFRLCTNPQYNNVYCDFGFFDRILDSSAAKRFAERLSAAIHAKPSFANKCCFGTDWHIIARKGPRKYISRFVAMLNGAPALEEHTPKFMRDNLLNYLKT